MFTGIVQGRGEVISIDQKQDFRRHAVNRVEALVQHFSDAWHL